jgi:plastocyanin
VLVAVLALALITAACSKSDNGGASTGTTGSTGSTGGTGSTGSTGSTASISIKNFAFDPNALTVSSGSTDITITNNDTVTHTFTLDDGSANVSIPAGTTKTVTVDITQTTGWHCSIHKTMTGTLTVA